MVVILSGAFAWARRRQMRSRRIATPPSITGGTSRNSQDHIRSPCRRATQRHRQQSRARDRRTVWVQVASSPVGREGFLWRRLV